jgi:hypothetical protein
MNSNESLHFGAYGTGTDSVQASCDEPDLMKKWTAWLMAGFTYDHTTHTIKLYLHGVEPAQTITVDDLVTSTATTASFDIGARPATDRWQGRLHCCALYSGVLSQADITWLYNGGSARVHGVGAPSGLVRFWPLGPGDTFPTAEDKTGHAGAVTTAAQGVRDLSVNSYHGTSVAMEDVDFTADTPGGVSNYSTSFGGSEYITMGTSVPELDKEWDEAFSIDFWIKTTTTGRRFLVSKREGSTTYRGYDIQIDINEYLWFDLCHDAAVSEQISVLSADNTGYRDGNWHHICWTYSGSGLASGVTLYIDAVADTPLFIANDNLTGTIVNTADFMLAYRLDQPADSYIGSMDEVTVHSSELSLSEVQAIFNAGAPVDKRNLSTGGNIDAYWDLGEGPGDDGVMTNMDAGDIVADSPHATNLIDAPTPVEPGPEVEFIGDARPFNIGTAPTPIPPGPQVIFRPMNPLTYYYLMRGVNAGGDFVHWGVEREPDLLAVYAPEPIPDLSTVTIAAKW